MKKIKNITRYRSVVGENDELLNEFKNSYQEFDINNNRIKDIDYTSSGEIETASGFKYNANNQLIEEMHYFDEDEVGEIVRYKLNGEGKPVEIETTYADGSVSLKKISRIENTLSIKSYDEDDDPEGEDIVKFNGEDKVVEELKYDEDHKIIYHTIYTHNNEGQVESKTVFGEKKEFLEKVVFEHDNNGNVTRETHLNRKDKPINQVVYNYNENGELGEWYNSQYLMQSKYDEKGRLVYEETRNRGNNLVESFTDYKFDKDGILLESRSFTLGEQYQLEPGVYARGKLTFIVIRHEYEFFNEEE